MLLRGIINIEGMPFVADLEITDADLRQKGVSFCPNVGSAGKWRAYKTVNGRNHHLGYYDNKEDASEAARQGRKLSERIKAPRDGIFEVARSGGTMWRATYMPAVGRRLMLGEYPTKGVAILVRDVVARRSGGAVTVADYEMPLTYVSNVIARSFIRDEIRPATADDAAEFDRRVKELSGTVREMPRPANLTIPDETWRTKQPSRTGHSPFDTLDTQFDAGDMQ